jgi:hypothetical protein
VRLLARAESRPGNSARAKDRLRRGRQAGERSCGQRSHGQELVLREGILEGAKLDEVLHLHSMTEIGVPGGKGIPAGG